MDGTTLGNGAQAVSRFRLAHLSDPHLGPLPKPAPAALLSKRVFGYINWVRNRGRAMGGAVLEALVEDIAAQRPDHVAVTGDLVNIALDEEFANAARWLARLGPPDRVTVVPGNHDAYVPGARNRALAAWADFARSDDGHAGYPVVRRRGEVALIGVSTAVATPPLFASGTVGSAQCEALAAALDRHDDAFKVVLIHHPPDPALAHGRRGLSDHAAVRQALGAGGANLVLHGHTHRSSLGELATVSGPAAMVGVPSASSDGSRHPLASYALIDIDLRTRTMRLTRRGPSAPGGPVRTLETLTLALRTAPALI